MTIFPFVAKPVFAAFELTNEEEYHQFISERRKLVPIWIKQLLEIKLKIFNTMEKLKYIFLLFIGLINAQETITLEQCYQWSRENYPLIKSKN